MPETVPTASDVELYNQLAILNETIAANAELSNNAAVMTALNKINSQPKSAFAQSAQVVGALNQVLPKFTNPNSNAEDYASGALQLTSSILFAASALPGAAIITAPLGLLVGLIGAIVGIFGNKPNMLGQFSVIVNDAVNRGVTEEVQGALAGAYENISENYTTLSAILSQHSSIPPGTNPFQDYQQITSFTTIASEEIGKAGEDLKKNCKTDHKNNWNNCADTFVALSQVVRQKIMFILQGIAFYNLYEVDGERTAGSRCSTLTEATKGIFDNYRINFGRYLSKPDLSQAGITHAVFRLPETRFRMIGSVFARMGTESWPRGASQFRFADGPYGEDCVRMTTLGMYNNTEDGKRKEKVLNYKMEFHGASADPTDYSQHLSLAGDDNKNYAGYAPDAEPPRYRWTIRANHNNNSEPQTMYIFEVVPSDSERKSYGITDTTNTLVMIGDPEQDHVWHSHSDDYKRERIKYADVLGSAHGVRSALWIFLDQYQ